MAEDSLVVSRADALASGKKRYFTGLECNRGHLAERYTCDGQCAQCVRDRLRRRCKTKVNAEARKRRATNPDAHKRAKAKYRDTNYDRYRALENAPRKLRYRNDPLYRAGCLARAMLQRVLLKTRARKDGRTSAMLGYTTAEFAAHIERQFVPGMSWEKIGDGVEIDHITAIATFVRQGVTDPRIINALPNLRPVFAEINRAKRDKVTHLI